MSRLVSSLLLVLVLVASSARAEQSTAQKVNDVVSYGTVYSQLGLDAIHVLREPEKGCHALQEGLKIGLTIVISETLKANVHRIRPDGSDYKDFPSEHTAIAFAARGWSVGWGVTLAVGTGVERRTANRHDWTGITAGALIGLGTDWIGSKVIHCS